MIPERLRILRRDRELTKRDLVALLPINYSTYANYESGFREPNSVTLQILAKFFEVSIDYILGVSDNRRRADEIAVLTDEEHDFIMKFRQLDTHGRELVDFIMIKEYDRVSLINVKSTEVINTHDNEWVVLQVYQQSASAGLGNYLNDESDNDYELMRFVATPISIKADFCVRIKGDSMEPKICDGDIVFVKAAPQIDPDNVGIFVYDGEAYCKRLRIDIKKGAVVLESLNKSFAPKVISKHENLRTVGLVIGIAE